jgi:hypothetical protein
MSAGSLAKAILNQDLLTNKIFKTINIFIFYRALKALIVKILSLFFAVMYGRSCFV